MKKIYVLDTNIILEYPTAILGFADNDVVITDITLGELDAKKTAAGEVGYNAREAIRMVETLRTQGNLKKGIKTPEGGSVRVTTSTEGPLLPINVRMSPDVKIMQAVLKIKEKSKKPVILVTNDISLRIQASLCDIEVESYHNEEAETEYTGLLHVKELSDAQASKLTENQYIITEDNKIYVFKEGEFIEIKNKRTFGVTPRNAIQICALNALTDPNIPLVVLSGPAGTAKTFLSLAAGLSQVYDSRSERIYDKILISRNNVLSDEGFGYLPGSIDEKMEPLLSPFYDNLESLLRGNGEETEQVKMQIEDMFEAGVIEVCPLAYMRGRSITNSYLIVDEAQNASRKQIRDIVTRAGKGTKVVVLGDRNQIDSISLTASTCAISYLQEKMVGSSACCFIQFKERDSVRSRLASVALARL